MSTCQLRGLRRVYLPAAILLMAGIFLFPGGLAQSSASAAATATTAVPLVTMTQRVNGCTVHVVGKGETLWAIAIAYGVKINDIRGLNGMGSDSTTIYPGETLVIRCLPLTPTVDGSANMAETPAKSKPLPTITPPLPTASRTRANPPTHTKTVVDASEIMPSAGSGPASALIAGMLILAGGTLVVVLAFVFVRKRP